MCYKKIVLLGGGFERALLSHKFFGSINCFYLQNRMSSFFTIPGRLIIDQKKLARAKSSNLDR